jgi:plastocyanin
MFPFRLAAAAALSLAAFASVPTSAQPVAAPVQTIGLYSYGYSPNPIVLAAGRPVTLTFVNRGRHGHDFTAKRFFRASRILSGSAPGGEVELAGGQSRSLTLIPAAGRYKVHCGHPFHSLMGMRAEVVVR